MADKPPTNIVDGMDQYRRDKMIAAMDEACISVHAQNQTLPELGLDDLRIYVAEKRWTIPKVGGVIFSIIEKPKNKITDVQTGRVAFHTLGKELVLKKQTVMVISLTGMLSAIDRANAFDEDVWLDEYDHLMVTNFFSKGEAVPLDATQRQRVTDYLHDRHDKGMITHVQINGFSAQASIDLSEWYGTSFWNWFREQQTTITH